MIPLESLKLTQGNLELPAGPLPQSSPKKIWTHLCDFYNTHKDLYSNQLHTNPGKLDATLLSTSKAQSKPIK